MRRMIIIGFGVTFLGALFGVLPMLAPVSFARQPAPQLYRPLADPVVVQVGAQPEGSPLVISVRSTGPGGEIATVAADLARLPDALYYDPVSNTLEPVTGSTPMLRVHDAAGADVYKVVAGKSYQYVEALTHDVVKATALPTNRWQVELPNVGRSESVFSITVTATSAFNQIGTASASLTVVDDITCPQISAVSRSLIPSPVVRVGDRVTIESEVVDDLSGVLSVRLVEEGARAIFGETPTVALTRSTGSSVWTAENSVADGVSPGTYVVEVAAADRAGNEAVAAVQVEVVEAITSLHMRLAKGWNLISVPRELVNPVVSEVFAGLPVRGVRSWVAGQWLPSLLIEPGLGYLVEAAEDTPLVVHFRNGEAPAPPIAIRLGEGWHLIGYASRTLVPMIPLTFYLGEDLEDEWVIVYADSGEQARPQSTSPYVWATDGFPTLTGSPYSEDPSRNVPGLELGKAYWVYLMGEGVLVP